MANKFILDASALLVLIYNEKADCDIGNYLSNSVMHIVNISEVLTVLYRDGMPVEIAEDMIKSMLPEIIYSSFKEASEAAQIKCANKKYGISSGDSFCLAAAKMHNYTIVTADKIWKDLDLNLEIILVR